MESSAILVDQILRESEVAETGDPVIRATLRSSREEAERVREVLASAAPLENEPHDPSVVELGDTVTVRRAGSTEQERFVIVGKLEARLDPTWISVESPLGSALLGSGPGQIVDVGTPEGQARFEILRIEPPT